MLRNTIIKCALTSVVAILYAVAVHSQEFNTHESISAQMKKGTVPGLKYGPTPVQSMKIDKNEDHSESSIAKIRKGNAQGMNFARGGSASPAPRRMARPGGGQKLASEQNMIPAAQPNRASNNPVAIPNQGNTKEAELHYKVPAQPVKKTEHAPALKAKAPVKKD